MPLDIQIKRSTDPARRGTTTVELHGSLDTATSPQLEQALAPLLASDLKELVFDLGGLAFVTSAGLRVFGIARKTLRERGGQVAFINMQPQVREVFDIIKSLPGMSIFKDTAEFDAYLTARQTRDRDDD